jgi:hypothetical protein
MPRPPITAEDYSDAIARLAATGRHTTGAGEAAARILLSTYDYAEWGFDAGDLARLDPEDRDAALTVLQARTELGEPQRFIHADDGDPEQTLRELWNIWRGSDQDMAS